MTMDAIRVSAKTLDDAITKACIELGATSETIEYEILETGSNGVFGIGAKPYVISACIKEPEELSPTEKAVEFLNSIFQGMKMTVNVDAECSEEES